MTLNDSVLHSLAMFQKFQNSEDAGKFFQVWNPHKLFQSLAGIRVRGHSAFGLEAPWVLKLWYLLQAQGQRLSICIFATPERSPGKGRRSNESNSCLTEGAARVHFAFSCSLELWVSSQLRKAHNALCSSTPDIEIHLSPLVGTN